MAVRKIRNRWWVDFRHQHIRYRKKSPDNSRSGAAAYEAVLRRRLAVGESVDLPTRRDGQDQTFKAFAWQWYESFVKNNNKPSEIRRKLYALRRNLIPFFADTPLSKIATPQVEAYKSAKLNAGLSTKTINNHLSVLSSCMRTAQDWLGLETLPKMKPLRVPPLSNDFLSIDDSRLLLIHSKGLWHDIILTALKTGLRVGELKALQWPDIDWQSRTLTVRHSWCHVEDTLDTPKNNRLRRVPLPDEVVEMLARKDRSTGFVFVDEHKRQFNVYRLNGEIRKACTAAGIHEITCHALRHTFASHLVIAGAPLKAVQELLGHAQIQTTMRYAHIAGSDLRDAVKKLAPLDISVEVLGNPRATARRDTVNTKVA